LILVPLVSVFYVLALFSFVVAGYYGFRLSRLTKKARVMVMVTKDGPASLVSGLVLLAASQVPNLIAAALGTSVADEFGIPAGILLVGSAIMFAWGFHRMYAVYLNERLKANVNNVLDELLEREAKIDEEKFQGQFK
jgi:maltodextrin utilization protein YvdJ